MMRTECFCCAIKPAVSLVSYGNTFFQECLYTADTLVLLRSLLIQAGTLPHGPGGCWQVLPRSQRAPEVSPWLCMSTAFGCRKQKMDLWTVEEGL